MNGTTLFINALALACLALGFMKDRAKTRRALKIAARSFVKILPMMLAIILIIGLMSGFVPPKTISRVVGREAGIIGVLTVAVLGAILHIPSLIAFPLAASLLEKGASVTSVAVFITTLTMIGFVTLPLETRILGKRFALLRNALSFIIAILIGLIMGVIL
ncbi:permease [Thermococcus sp. 9N3]|uniref:permease n=1 Tax=Thermococcus sp. 9N3 TaxID=163002 RepID=UPI001431F3DA|nr:permease [Thermococcus sp. 9N3]NJE48965.1 permease [Thermococcus sp. 9N3]